MRIQRTRMKSRRVKTFGMIPDSVPVNAGKMVSVDAAKAVSSAVKAASVAVAVREDSSVVKEVSIGIVAREVSNAVKAASEETAAREVFSAVKAASNVAKEVSNAAKAVSEETAAREASSVVKAVFANRALAADLPAVSPAETGAVND